MGKKVKKVVGKLKKFTEKFDPLGAGLLNPIADGISDQYLGTDWSGAKADAKAADAQQRDLQAAMANQAANANVDLSVQNVADTEIGGTANAQASTATRRKKQGIGGVAASLGINA